MGATSAKIRGRSADLPDMPVSEVQGTKAPRVSINYETAHQQVSIPMDVFLLILDFTTASGRVGEIRFTQCCGALDALKLIVAKNLAATCKMYHRHFLGTVRGYFLLCFPSFALKLFSYRFRYFSHCFLF
jgi:hypothetical protein